MSDLLIQVSSLVSRSAGVKMMKSPAVRGRSWVSVAQVSVLSLNFARGTAIRAVLGCEVDAGELGGEPEQVVLDEIGREVRDGVAPDTGSDESELLEVAGAGDRLVAKVLEHVPERGVQRGREDPFPVRGPCCRRRRTRASSDAPR